MLNLQGHLGPASLPGDENLVVPATPTGFVGGMPLKRTADGLTLATGYNATNSIVGLASYSEATFLRDAQFPSGSLSNPSPQYISPAKASYVRDAVGIQIGQGTDPQSQIPDKICPYDTLKTYHVEDFLYVNVTTGQITNALADAGTSPKVLGKVKFPPVIGNGDPMTIHIFADLQ